VIVIVRSFFVIILSANITLNMFTNAASLFFDHSFIYNGGYKALLLALKSGDHNTQKKSRLIILLCLYLQRMCGQFVMNYTMKSKLTLIASLKQAMRNLRK